MVLGALRDGEWGVRPGVVKMTLGEFSLPSRVADPGEGIGLDELQLAARNHGMLAEALQYDITPVGLHYLLVHYDVPPVAAETWRLQVDGQVGQRLSLTLDQLRSRVRVKMPVTMECAGNGRARLLPRPVSQPWLVDAVGTAEWTGTPLAPLLQEAGVSAEAVDVVFTGADHGVERGVEQDYQRALPLDDALRPEVLLAYEMNGAPLPPQHGFPCRLIVPGWYGMTQVKWLRAITVSSRPFDGYQNAVAYRIKKNAGEAGVPVTRIRPRAAIRPPGDPDFLSRTRFLSLGEHELTGRAWSGSAPVTRVSVSVDGGASWADAKLEAPPGRWAWARWTWPWRVETPGRYDLLAIAEDATGDRQPVDQYWNVQGMANNMGQHLTVYARAPQE
jgi:sulfane dehydrogenase subunit SoxC